MLHLFTFCVQIGKHSNIELLRVLQVLNYMLIIKFYIHKN